MTNQYRVMLLLFILLLGACSSNTSPQEVESETVNAAQTIRGGNPIIIGDVSSRPDEVVAFYQPLADYLAEALASEGITHGVVNVTPSLETMEVALLEGEVDIYLDSLYPSSIVSQGSGSQLVLRHWRDFVGEYNTVIFTLADSPFASLTDLRGEVVAFDRPQSTSGYFLPATYLLENNFDIVNVEEATNVIRDSEIGYIFSGDDLNIFNWVITGRTAAGATNNIEFDSLPEDVRANLRIIAETASAPSQVVSLRPGLDASLAEAIIRVMTDMENNQEGASVLESIETTRFDDLPGGSEAYTERIFNQLDLVTGG